LARSFGIPVVVGVVDLCENVDNGDTIIVDGFREKLLLNLIDKH